MKRFILVGLILLSFICENPIWGENEAKQETWESLDFTLSDFTHRGGYWKCVLADDAVFVTEKVVTTAKDENTSFFKVYPQRSGNTYLFFEFYLQTDSETPWFYIEYVVKIEDDLTMSVSGGELVPCLEHAYYQ